MAADPWEWWNQMRFLCHHNSRLGVVLELGADLPATEDLQRWRGEPLKWAGRGGGGSRAGAPWHWASVLAGTRPAVAQRCGLAHPTRGRCHACVTLARCPRAAGMGVRDRGCAVPQQRAPHRCTHRFSDGPDGAAFASRADVPCYVPGTCTAAWSSDRAHARPRCSRAVLVPTSIFMTNKRGYPTLSKRHQEFLTDCFRRGVQVGGAAGRLRAARRARRGRPACKGHAAATYAHPRRGHRSCDGTVVSQGCAPGCAGRAVGQCPPRAARVGASWQRAGGGPGRGSGARSCAAEPAAFVLGVPLLPLQVASRAGS